MRKLIVSNLITLDGFFAGPNGEIDWHNVDEEFNEYATRMLNNAGTLLFGRVTYDLMANYWPTEDGVADDPIIAEMMNNLPKVVFSRTMEKAEWNNTSLIKENIAQEIAEMKKQAGQDLVILGSGTIVQQLTKIGLIDEFRLIVNPIILGAGKTLFKDVDKKINLKLLETRTFKSGNVLLCYGLHK